MKLILLIILSLVVFAQANAQQKHSADDDVSHELSKGAEAYKDRRFSEAEIHFRLVLQLEPGNKAAQVFLARDLHQQFLANRRKSENVKKGEEAFELYQKFLADDLNDQRTSDALASLIESLKGKTALKDYRTERANNEQVKPAYRAQALTFLAGEKYSCVNEITEAAKDAIVENNETVFVFRKSENAEDFIKAKQCADDGLRLIDKALALDNSKSSPHSYKTSLLIQKSRLAQMEGNIAEIDKFKAEAEAPKKRFEDLSEAEAEAREKEVTEKEPQ